jgi:hypothetical protein
VLGGSLTLFSNLGFQRFFENFEKKLSTQLFYVMQWKALFEEAQMNSK